MPKKRNYLDEYLSEIISYGGIPYTRGAVIAEMQSEGIEQVCIDRWLQGQELAARIDARRQQENEALFGDTHRPLQVSDAPFKKAPRRRTRAAQTQK